MGQRNMLCTSQMSDMELDQQAQGYLCPVPNYLDMHRFPEPYEGAVFYGMPQYIHVQDHQPPSNLDLAAPNFYNAYAPSSSSSGLVPVDQLSSSSNYAAFGVPNSQPMDGLGGPCKRKHAEGVLGNFQYYNSSASSSSSAVPFNTRHHPEGVAIMDEVSFGLPQFRGNGMMMEAGSQQSVHGHNHLIQGNFVGQPFQRSGTRWIDQQISSNASGGGASAWARSPPMPYVENGGMALHGYHETGSNRSSSSFLHPPPNHPHFNLHYPLPQPVQGARVHNVNVYPQVPGTSYRHPSQDGLEVASRHPRPVPTTGFGIYRPPHQGRDMPETTTLRYQNSPRFRYYQADEVAIMESPEFYEAGNAVDHHRDMRMDIEDMTYEDLLALEERIGNVKTGLTEDDIVKQMKTRTSTSYPALINLEEPAPSVDEESDSCIICQDEYINKEKIGTLGCGHEYHADCLKKWLLVKNVCPICKSEALSMGPKQA